MSNETANIHTTYTNPQTRGPKSTTIYERILHSLVTIVVSSCWVTLLRLPWPIQKSDTMANAAPKANAVEKIGFVWWQMIPVSSEPRLHRLRKSSETSKSREWGIRRGTELVRHRGSCRWLQPDRQAMSLIEWCPLSNIKQQKIRLFHKSPKWVTRRLSTICGDDFVVKQALFQQA